MSLNSLPSMRLALFIAISALSLLAVGCRYDMQDQPRYKVYKESSFFSDRRKFVWMPESGSRSRTIYNHRIECRGQR